MPLLLILKSENIRNLHGQVLSNFCGYKQSAILILTKKTVVSPVWNMVNTVMELKLLLVKLMVLGKMPVCTLKNPQSKCETSLTKQ